MMGIYSGNLNYGQPQGQSSTSQGQSISKNPFVTHQNNQLDQMRQLKNSNWTQQMPNANQPQHRSDDLESYGGSECGTDLDTAFAQPTTHATFSKQFTQVNI